MRLHITLISPVAGILVILVVGTQCEEIWQDCNTGYFERRYKILGLNYHTVPDNGSIIIRDYAESVFHVSRGKVEFGCLDKVGFGFGQVWSLPKESTNGEVVADAIRYIKKYPSKKEDIIKTCLKYIGTSNGDELLQMELIKSYDQQAIAK